MSVEARVVAEWAETHADVATTARLAAIVPGFAAAAEELRRVRVALARAAYEATVRGRRRRSR